MSEIERKRRQVRKQGYAAAKKDNGIYPRELQNVPGDRWEDAKVYNKNTRQGQNYWRDHLSRPTERRSTSNNDNRGTISGQTRRLDISKVTGSKASNEMHGSITKQKPNVKQKQNEQNSGRNNELLRKRQRQVLEDAFKRNKKR